MTQVGCEINVGKNGANMPFELVIHKLARKGLRSNLQQRYQSKAFQGEIILEILNCHIEIDASN